MNRTKKENSNSNSENNKNNKNKSNGTSGFKKTLNIKNKSKNSVFVVILIIMFFTYGFFLMSTSIFKPSENSLVYTKIGELSEIGTRNFVISEWKYCENQDKMQVTLLFDTETISSEIYEYDYYSMTRKINKKTEDNECKKIYSSNSVQVIEIENVPKDFAEVSLVINSSDKLLEDDENVNENIIYTNMYKVTSVDNIESKTPLEYEVDRLNYNKNSYEKEIKTIEKTIKKLTDDNKDIDKQMKELEKEKIYATSVDYEKINEQITSYQNQIITNNETIKEQEIIIKEKKGLIEEIKLKIIEFKERK